MKNLILCLSLLLPLTVNARITTPNVQKGWVTVRPGQRLYVEHYPAANGKPTVWVANGLTWSTEQWQSYVDALKKLDPDLGIVAWDMEGQGKTLLDKAPINFDIPLDHQIQDLRDLRDTLNIPGPQILVGLSYGGGIALQYLATYPADFQKIVAVSPYIHPMPTQVLWIKQQIQANRMMFPLNPASDDELYDYFLHVLVQTQYPMLEPIMLTNPFKIEGVYRMAKGSKTFDAAKLVALFPAGKLHLVTGENDPFVTLVEQSAFWQAVPKWARGSWIIIKDTSHKPPEERPDYMAGWTHEIINNNQVSGGREFTGEPAKGTATAGSVTIPMPKASACETLLRRIFRPF
jgi:pimeloyl-ACP methyl ester carboxylesterase